MKALTHTLIVFILFLSSCNKTTKKEKPLLNSDSINQFKLKREVQLKTDYSTAAKLFAEEILRDNIRTHEFDLTKLEKPNYLRIFKSNGLKKIIAYSNKNYPQKSEPSYYQHFTLFVATFVNQKSAKLTFERIKSDSKYGLTDDWSNLKNETLERVKALAVGAKPGGMIIQIGTQIFSLVETCGEVPFGANWIEYENRLLKYLTRSGNEEFEILNADCGNDRYRYKKTKARR